MRKQTVTEILQSMVRTDWFDILIRSNKMQQMQVFIYCTITVHVSGVYRTHHQEYIKL